MLFLKNPNRVVSLLKNYLKAGKQCQKLSRVGIPQCISLTEAKKEQADSFSSAWNKLNALCRNTKESK